MGYTGSPQTYTVPADIPALRVTATGASGADNSQTIETGGLGALVQATLAVTPGEVLPVYVGGVGRRAA